MSRVATALILASLATGAAAQNGISLALSDPALSRSTERSVRLGFGENLRLDLSLAQLGDSQVRARIFGDYYLTGPGFGEGQLDGGLRVTTGLSSGPGGVTPALPPQRLFGSVRRDVIAPLPALADRDTRVTLPYIGVGYTTTSARAGWGLSADIGLGGQRHGDRVRLGAGTPTAAQFENLLNDLRLAPVVQLGVSYAF